MITRETAPRWRTSDGKKHESLREAQIHELDVIFGSLREAQLPELDVIFEGFDNNVALVAATLCVQHAEKVLDVLTTRKNSLPKARAINGGTKKRRKALAVIELGENATTTAV